MCLFYLMFANCLNLSAIVLVDSVITSLEGAVLATGLDANDSVNLAVCFCFLAVPPILSDSANVENTNFTSLREARKRGMEYFRQGIFISLINGNNVKLPL